MIVVDVGVVVCGGGGGGSSRTVGRRRAARERVGAAELVQAFDEVDARRHV